MGKKGFSTLEILMVVVIIGIVAALTVANLSSVNERSLDDQVKNALILIQRAERAHEVENGIYYPAAGNTPATSAGIQAMNQNLGLSLPSGTNRAWNYQVWSTGCSRATRNGSNLRSWYFTINDADDVPDQGAGCP